MAGTVFQLRANSTPGAVPADPSLSTAELALNTGDGKLFAKMANGTVIQINQGGSAANTFGTISVSGQSDVVADSTTDTLTLAVANGLVITTVAGTDTITFSAQVANTSALGVVALGNYLTVNSTGFISIDSAGVIGALGYTPLNPGSAQTITAAYTYQTTQNDGAVGPTFKIKRVSSAPANGNELGVIQFTGPDSGGNETVFAEIEAVSNGVTDTAENGKLVFRRPNAGAMSNALTIASGLVIGTAGGGDPGTGGVNMSRARFNGTNLEITSSGSGVATLIGSGNVAVSGNSSTGTVTLGANGPVLITLSPSGQTTFSNTVALAGSLTTIAAANVTGLSNMVGAVTMANTLGVTGAVTLSNTLSVTNAVTFSNTGSFAGLLTASVGANVVGQLQVTGTAVGNSLVVVRGGGAAAEGGQLTLGYGNNLAAAITAQANNTWNIDVLADSSFRIFRLDNTGTSLTLMTSTEAGNVSWLGGNLAIDTTNSRVGIGTTSPNAKLQVAGTANVSGNAVFSANLQVNGTTIINVATFVDKTTTKTNLGVKPPTVQYLTSNGTYTPTTGATVAFVELTGGGGGGGGADGSNNSRFSAGGGGGSGGFACERIVLSGTYTYTIGAGGTAGTNTGGNGGNGGTTSFGTGPLLQATGGAGGNGFLSSSTGDGVAGGVGGAGSGGDLNLNGASGGPGVFDPNGNSRGGSGGASFFAPGGTGSYTGTNGSTAGENGQAGSGGGGASLKNTTTGAAGGTGGAGLIKVTEYYE